MKLPSNIANQVLAVLIKGSGYPSLAQFAHAINKYGARRYGVDIKYDHTSVKRWLRGGRCEHRDVVAEVLAAAWAVPIDAAVIWPGTREGSPPTPAHLYPCVADRTVERLETLLVSDLLTRREVLADSVAITDGTAVVESMTRWLRAEAVGLRASDRRDSGRINLATIEEIESATRRFMSIDATLGGGLCREAAIGQLKYAINLMQRASFSIAIGNRLLSAIAKLAGEIGWMNHDVGMEGPAQQYFILGLQAAHESTDDRAPIIAIGILTDMARQMRKLGQSASGIRLLDLAFEYLPDYARGGSIEAMLWNLKGRTLSLMETNRHSEVESALNLSSEIFANSDETRLPPWQRDILKYIGTAELQRHTSGAYLTLATRKSDGRRFAIEAEKSALEALKNWGKEFERERAYSLVDLAHARFLLDRPEEACDDGERAIRSAANVRGSLHLSSRLKELDAISQTFDDKPRVAEFRKLLQAINCTYLARGQGCAGFRGVCELRLSLSWGCGDGP